jgi:hypothetical protein
LMEECVSEGKMDSECGTQTDKTCATRSQNGVPQLIETGPDDGCVDKGENITGHDTISQASPLPSRIDGQGEAVPTIVRQVDGFLIKLSQWSSSTSNTDKGLKLLQYSLWFLSRVSERLQGNQCTPRTEALVKISSNISMARFVLRFYGELQQKCVDLSYTNICIRLNIGLF